jgi:hypothetical protein
LTFILDDYIVRLLPIWLAVSSTITEGSHRDMKFGFRKPSLKKKLAARTSLKRVVRHRMGIKAPKGYGWLTNPKKAAYNKVYNKTSTGCSFLLTLVVLLVITLIALLK